MILVTLFQARLFKRGHTPSGHACQSGALLVRCLGARFPGTSLVRQRQASVKHSAPFLLKMSFISRRGLGCHHQTEFASVKSPLDISMISFIDHKPQSRDILVATEQPPQARRALAPFVHTV